MSTSRFRSGAHYLSLALFARRVVDGLIRLLEGDETRNLDWLDEALKSLNAVQKGTGRSPTRAVRHYSQVQTLRASSTGDSRDRIIQLLANIKPKAQTGELGELKPEVLQAIDFFFDIEKRALAHFERPPAEATPSKIVELCKRT